MEQKKFRVWWQTIDEDGNVRVQGVDSREYTTFGYALRRGAMLFGKDNRWTKDKDKKPGLTWRISPCYPWDKKIRRVELNES